MDRYVLDPAIVGVERQEGIMRSCLYPVNLPETAINIILDILATETWFDDMPILARAIWEITGYTSSLVFGDPAGLAPKLNNLCLGQIRLLNKRLSTCLLTLKAPATATGATVQLREVYSLSVLIECFVRIVRLLETKLSNV